MIDTEKQTQISSQADAQTKTPTELLIEQVWAQLKLCYDPEIPVNIVDLGFIYGIEAQPALEKPEKYDVNIRMTLTTPGCSMGGFILPCLKLRA